MILPIPFMRLDRQYTNLKEALLKNIDDVLSSGQVLQGPKIQQLEQHLCSLLHKKHAICLGSGTDALVFALRAQGVGQGDKVAVTSLSFIASASSIALLGATPVFVDIDEFYQTSEPALLRLIEKAEIKGIVAVHLYGQMMDLSSVYSKAQEKNIFVIEDAAQALGATRNGHPPGKYSDGICISFDPTKVIGAYGSGGMYLTDNIESANAVKKYRYHGLSDNNNYAILGHNSQLASIQAAILLEKLKYLDTWQERRQAIAKLYDFALKDITYIQAPKIAKDNQHNYHKYVLCITGNKRAVVESYLTEKGIEVKKHYNMPLHQQPCFKDIENSEDLSNVETISGNVLSLPIYPELDDDEIAYICQSLEQLGDI
jgi:dTDP-4-amino-4,6-dideoxygalactose transaminase